MLLSFYQFKLELYIVKFFLSVESCENEGSVQPRKLDVVNMVCDVTCGVWW